MTTRPTSWRAHTGTHAHAPVPPHAAFRPARWLSSGPARGNAAPVEPDGARRHERKGPSRLSPASYVAVWSGRGVDERGAVAAGRRVPDPPRNAPQLVGRSEARSCGTAGVSACCARPPLCSGPAGDAPSAPRLRWQLWALRPGLNGASRPSTALTGCGEPPEVDNPPRQPGAEHVVNKGATPVLSTAEARRLLKTINLGSPAGLRSRSAATAVRSSLALSWLR